MIGSDFKTLGAILKLLGEPSRLRILHALGVDCRPVNDIVHATGLTQTNVSFHLRLLRQAGLVRPERRGPFVYYCLPDGRLLDILDYLAAWIETRHEAERDQQRAVSGP